MEPEILEADFSVAPISTIPNEILDHILTHLTFADLLHTSRLVCKTWGNTATCICSRRFVRLNQTENPNLLYNLKPCYAVPWSFVIINSYKAERWSWMRSTFTAQQIRQFISTFGIFLRKIEICGDNAVDIEVILRGIPNVEELIFKAHYLDSPNFGTTLKLKKVKRLEVRIASESCPPNLAALLSICGNRLEYVHLTFWGGAAKEPYGVELIGILQTIPNVTLSFKFESTCHSTGIFEACLDTNLVVKRVILRITVSQNFDIIEEFLLSIARHLTQLLLIKDFYLAKGSSTRLLLPHFPVLKHLCLSYRNQFETTNEDPPFSFLSPFTRNQFPFLKTISLENFSNRNSIFSLVQFDSVQEFYHSGVLEFPVQLVQKAFPNLMKYHGKVNTQGLMFILKKMKQLVEINLQVTSTMGNNVNLNGLLSGIPDPTAIQFMTDEEIRQHREKYKFPSILGMTSLKRLTVAFQEVTTLEDSEARLALLQIQSLEYLSIINCEISGESKKKLAVYHGTFICS